MGNPSLCRNPGLSLSHGPDLIHKQSHRSLFCYRDLNLDHVLGLCQNLGLYCNLGIPGNQYLCRSLVHYPGFDLCQDFGLIHKQQSHRNLFCSRDLNLDCVPGLCHSLGLYCNLGILGNQCLCRSPALYPGLGYAPVLYPKPT